MAKETRLPSRATQSYSMFAIAKAVAVSGLLFFGGSLLLAAADPFISCRLQYRYAGFDVDARCAGECTSSACVLNVSIEGSWIVYTCLCEDGTMHWCPGALYHDQGGIGGGCLFPYSPCGWHMEYECWGYYNPWPYYVDACSCVIPTDN